MNDIVNRALALTNAYARGGSPAKAQKAPPTPQQMAALASDLGRVRSTSVGRLTGEYQTLPEQEAVQKMYSDLLGLAREGTPGRKWYEKSSKRILQYFNGDKEAADKFAQLIAIYSPQTTVPINTANAIKAYNRALSGQQIWNGDIIDADRTFKTIKEAGDYVKSLGGEKAGITRVPLDDTGKRYLIARHLPGSYENIATADRDLKAHLLMNHGLPFEGRKTNNFYNNLMVHIDPKRLQGSTQDLWMAHAFGFPDTAIGMSGKYTFMENLTQHLADQLGWRPHQVQAAIWTAIKSRMEATSDAAKRAAVEQGLATMAAGPKGRPVFSINPGKEDAVAALHRTMALGQPKDRKRILSSARDFSDFLDQNLADVAWESVPSKRIEHLNGMESLPYGARAEYHGLVSKALQDKKGNDLLAQYLGIMSPGHVDAPGYWEGISNPASHTMVGSTRIKAAAQSPEIDAPSKELLDIYAAAKGLLHKQDGVGYHRPYFNPKITEANGVEYNFDKDLDHNHILAIGRAFDQHAPGVAVVPINSKTVRLLNFADSKEMGWKDQRGFHDTADAVMSKYVPATHSATARHFGFDGNLIGNDWEANPNGEDYKARLRASARPDVLEYLSSVLAPRLEDVDRSFAQKYGLKTSPRHEAAVRSGAQAPAPVSMTIPVPDTEGSPVDHALRLSAQNGSPLPDAVDLARQQTRGRP